MAEKVSNPISPARQAEYKRTYDRLMERARGRTYEKGIHERHHIHPKSLGGDNQKENIVCLTYREHFLAHWLLTKFTEKHQKMKMLNALWRMSHKSKNHKDRFVSSWQYAVCKQAIFEYTNDPELKLAMQPIRSRIQKEVQNRPDVKLKRKKTKESQEFKERASLSQKRAQNSLETKMKRKSYFEKPETKLYLSAIQTEVQNRPEVILKRNTTNASIESKKRRSIGNKRAHAAPGSKQRRGSAIHAALQKLGAAALSERIYKGWETRRKNQALKNV